MRLKAPFVLLTVLGAFAATGTGCDRTFQDAIVRSPTATMAQATLTPQSSRFTPGRYCYQTTSANLTAQIRVNVSAQGHVSGDTVATIHHREANYYSSYQQTFTGRLQERPNLPALAQLNVTTWIEYDVQSRSENWSVTPQILKTHQETLQMADCALINKAFQNQAGLEATDLLDAATALHRKTISLSDRPTTVRNSVIRGERDVYEFSAQGGRMLTIDIQAVERNAAFDVISPSGMILAQDTQHKQILLTQTGNYQVIVGGTRGNATYTLTMRLSPDP